MFYVLVKFYSQTTPVVMGTTHIAHASKLATMDDVEWVSPNISNSGSALPGDAENGGWTRDGLNGKVIVGYSHVN